MASIRERHLADGTKTYQVQLRLRGKKPIAATFRRKTDAIKWIQQTESAIREGRFFPSAYSKRKTVSEMIDRFLYEELPSRPKFRHEYKSQLNFWRKELGHLRLSDVTQFEISAGRDHLSKVVTRRHKVMSPATVNRHLAALSSAFRVAINEWGWLKENPVRQVKKLRESRGRTRFLSDDERKNLLEACRSSKNADLYDVVLLALCTGARRMELWNLNWSDIDFKNQIISFKHTKNSKTRSLPMTDESLQILTKRSKLRRLGTQLIFPSKKDPQKPMDFRAPFERAINESKIEDFKYHDLRHSCASYLAMSGVPIRTIAEILGHSNTSVTVRYSHLNKEHLKKSLDELSKVLAS